MIAQQKTPTSSEGIGASVYIYHVESAEGDVYPESDTLVGALANYTKGDMEGVAILDDWQPNESDSGPVETATITNQQCPEAIMVRAHKPGTFPTAADCDLPAETVFQCYCERCQDPLFSSDKRRSYRICTSCQKWHDEESPAAIRERNEQNASDLHDYKAWRRS